MKRQKKGQNPQSRSARSRSNDGSIDPSLGTAGAAPVERPAIDPGAPSVREPDATPAAPADLVPAAEVMPEPTSAGLAPSLPVVPAAGVGQPVSAAAPGRVAASTALRPRAEQIVKEYVPLAIGAGMIPLPGFDLAAIGGLQLKVLSALAELYHVSFSKAQAQLIVTSLVGSVGTTMLAGAALVSVAKVVPFFGTLVGAASMPVAGGVITHALGHLAIDHFEAGGTMETFDLDVAQQAFIGKLAEARAALA